METKIILMSVSAAFLLAGCTAKSETNVVPLMNLEWFSEISDVKDSLSDYNLLEEREGTDGGNTQNLLDYSGTELFEADCDLTLCFIEQGLVGFNYHDIEKNNTYNEWFEKIETVYGIPTEKGSGMASWYDDPVGKSTALYLFNLEEGVQISFYATSNTPDKSYSGQSSGSIYVPTPELRTPIVPVTDDNPESETTTTKSTSDSGNSGIQTSVITNELGEVIRVIDVETESGIETPEEENGTQQVQTSASSSSSSTGTTDKNSSSTSSAAAGTQTTAVTTVSAASVTTKNKTEDFRQNILQFYATPEFERRRMSIYNQVYEYKTEEAGQPWELIMQYENVPYCNKNCDTVLCFTSLGLVGINYFDDDSSAYDEWIANLTEIYGQPTDSKNDYTSWNNNPLGEDTMVYIFALEDGVQISFFADDEGSELS